MPQLCIQWAGVPLEPFAKPSSIPASRGLRPSTDQSSAKQPHPALHVVTTHADYNTTSDGGLLRRHSSLRSQRLVTPTAWQANIHGAEEVG
jgi:hypothetical protein